MGRINWVLGWDKYLSAERLTAFCAAKEGQWIDAVRCHEDEFSGQDYEVKTN